VAQVRVRLDLRLGQQLTASLGGTGAGALGF